MAATTLQGRRAMPIYASDTIDIPNINNLYTSGVNTTATTNKLTASAGNFINLNVKAGDIIYNLGTNRVPSGVATVTAVDSATTLSLSADIFPIGGGTNNAYRIFRAIQNGGDTNPGCLLIPDNSTLGTQGRIRILTVGGDDITIPFPTNSYGFIPLQIVKLFSTGTTAGFYGNCNVMW